MKTKLDLAHEYAMKHLVVSNGCITVQSLCGYAWDYADEMYKQLEEREIEEQKKSVESHKKFMSALSGAADQLKNKETGNAGDWQPDWSQAPEKAMYWAMDADNSANFFKQKPEITNGNGWDFGGVMQSDRNHNYPYNWQNSLRKRPEGK